MLIAIANNISFVILSLQLNELLKYKRSESNFTACFLTKTGKETKRNIKKSQ